MNHKVMIHVAKKEDKGTNYTTLFSRYNKAYKQGFYYECLVILYAMIEDRTKALFYYLGMTSSTREGVVKKYKSDIRILLNMNETDTRYGFNSLSGKLANIKKLVNGEYNSTDLSPFMEEIIRALDKYMKNDLFREKIIYLDSNWRCMRNEITHALMIKDYYDLSLKTKPIIDEGLDALRVLDNAVKNIKRQNIRKKFRIQ